MPTQTFRCSTTHGRNTRDCGKPRSCLALHSVLVVDPYGLTATTAASSLEGWCREVTVTHSPGFTVLIAARLLSGTFTRIVMS